MKFVIVLLLLSFTRNIIQMVMSDTVGCENDTTCKSWEHCEISYGATKECYGKDCDSDDTCGDGAMCHFGSCVGLRSECDIICKSWEDCISYYDDLYECYGKLCDSDDTCGDGAKCFHGICAGLGCESDITCNSWEYCVTFDFGQESCVNKRCDSDDTCGDGATCFSGFNLTECIGCEDVGYRAFHGWIEDLNNFQDVCEKCEDDKNVTNFFSCETQTTPVESTPGESNESPDCTICTDEPTPGMIAKGKMCSQRQNFLKTKCNKKRSWTEAKFCQASCYEAGNGYEGDECCATET